MDENLARSIIGGNNEYTMRGGGGEHRPIERQIELITTNTSALCGVGNDDLNAFRRCTHKPYPTRVYNGNKFETIILYGISRGCKVITSIIISCFPYACKSPVQFRSVGSGLKGRLMQKFHRMWFLAITTKGGARRRCRFRMDKILKYARRSP